MTNLFHKASWICDPQKRRAPIFEKCFQVKGGVETGILYATAMGVYEVYLNDVRIDNSYMKPGWTEYKKRLQYQTFDVSASLKPGENKLTAYVASGWCVGEIGHEGYRNFWADQVEFLAQLVIAYPNESQEIIATDATWQAGEGMLIYSEIYDGISFDARRTPQNFCNAVKTGRSKENLIPQEGAPVRVTDTLSPVALLRTPKGETVLDFGQNMTGIMRFSLNAHAGDRVEISCAEVLDPNGNFYTENYRSAKSKLTYICKEGTQEFEPQLTFFGFRYIRLDAWPQKADTLEDVKSFRALVLHSDMKRTGYFNSSHALLNQLFHNIVWGQRGNFLDVPTDCPQRNERLGWTGDAQAFVKTASYNYDVRQFFKKWLRDMAVSQFEDGGIPNIVPNVFQLPEQRCSAAWADAVMICTWQMYLTYGDRELLKEMFPCMQKWVEYIRAQGENKYLWNTGEHFGDWLGLDLDEETAKEQAKRGYYSGATNQYLIATAFYAYDVALLIKAGEILGEDMREYQELYDHIKTAFRKEFIKDNVLTSDTQTAWVLALHFGLLPNPKEGAKHLLSLIKKTGHMTTGFVGTPYLLHVLHNNGYTKEAYSLLLREEYPSWLYSVKMGATTMWEHWDGIRPDGSMWGAEMNSFNHYAYGAVGDWLYEVAAGIQLDEKKPGFQHIIFAPAPDARLGFVEASIEAKNGTVSSSWHIEGDEIRYRFGVPKGSTATIVLNEKQFEVSEGEHEYLFAYEGRY